MVEFYLKVLGQKNSSLASGNRPDKNFLSLTRPFNQCVSEYAFLISKNNKQTTTKARTKRSKRN